jgi:hypothetical protein
MCCIPLPLHGNIKFTNTNLDDSFIYSDTELPSHSRDWPRQHILPLRLDSQVVIRRGENLEGKTMVMINITVARR